LGEIARSTGCTAIAGPTAYGTLNPEEALFEAAASSEIVRFVATLGPGQADGAIDLAPERLRPTEALPAAILPDFQRAGLLCKDVLASTIAVRRREAPLELEGDCPLIEVQALGESRIEVQRRTRANSQPAPILCEVLAPVPPLQQAERS
jgi:hypothetical protein